MILLEYWSIMEITGIIGILALFVLRIIRSTGQRKQHQDSFPKTSGGKIGYAILYILRIVGVGVGAFLAIALFVIVERNIYSVITESMPAPSEVHIPTDLSFRVEEVTFEGGDDLKMAGWKVPSRNGVTIILLHGYGGNRTAMLWHAQQLVRAGYGVLMYDERASGESEGTHRSYGWEDPRDVQGAIRFIETQAKPGPPRIGIAGCSIGAQIALQSAAYYPEIEAVWADGPSSVRAKDLPSPQNPITALIILGNYSLDWMFELRLGMDAPSSLVDIIGSIAPRPIMLVGGGRPQPLIGSEGEMMIPRYARVAGSNAQTWIIPEAVHCDGPGRRPDEYAGRMVEFFNTAFGIKQ